MSRNTLSSLEGGGGGGKGGEKRAIRAQQQQTRGPTDHGSRKANTGSFASKSLKGTSLCRYPVLFFFFSPPLFFSFPLNICLRASFLLARHRQWTGDSLSSILGCTHYYRLIVIPFSNFHLDSLSISGYYSLSLSAICFYRSY